MTNLRDKAMLVTVKVSKWSGRKFDRKATKEVNDLHNTADAGRFNKILVNKDEIAAITKKESAIRKYLYDNTLPWGDNGDRLLPSAHFLKFGNTLGSMIDEFDDLTDQFVANYQTHIDDAKVRLNGLFNPNDYPHSSEIASKFGVRKVVMAIPNSADIRVEGMSDDEIAKLQAEVEADIIDRHNDAINDLYGRVKEVVKTVTAALGRLESKDKARFANSLIGNIQNLVELIPTLNYTNDLKLARLGEELKSLVVDPDNLKSDSSARAAYLDRAKQLDDLFF